MPKTSIEWCDYTINPVVGCSKCSPGCKNCYAERFATRMAKNPNPKIAAKYKGVVDDKGLWMGKTSCLDLSCFDKLPKKPCRAFVGSMTDIFHAYVPYERLDQLFYKISNYPQHTFMFLTKRPHNAYRYFPHEPTETWLTEYNALYTVELPFPLSNVWLGVTICTQQEADEKLPILMKIPAAKRFVSVEPMLEAVNLEDVRFTYSLGFFGDALRWHHLPYGSKSEDYPALDWVICGAETGPRARPMELQWARDLRDQCQAARVPFFFKKCSPKQKTPDDLMIRDFPE